MIARALTLLPDERLAQLAARGSDPAFAALYDRYKGVLFAYCRSITRNVDDGWDALQNAMVKVLVALRRSPDRAAPVRPWLFCICHNEAIGILRRRAAAERVAEAFEWRAAAAADEQAFAREQVKEVVSDVQQLPTGQRAALVMRELGDLRYDEIAVALETTEGNARQLVFAARAGLRDSRAGRGLPCDSVRDQLSQSDGRFLRRRSVRAHLRTCEGCRAYADSVRRRPAAALFGWPVAGYELLASALRTAASGVGAGPLAAKTAAVAAVLATSIGAADVATMKPGTHVTAGAPAKAKPRRVARVAARPATGKARPSVVAAVDPPAPHVRVVAAAYAQPVHRSVATPTAAPATRPSRSRASQPAPAAAPAAPRDPAPQQPQQQHTQSAVAARSQADCNPPQAPQREQVRYEPQQQTQQQQPRQDQAPPQ